MKTGTAGAQPIGADPNALARFWDVYRRNYDAVTETVRQRALEEPDLERVVGMVPQEGAAERREATRRKLAAAFEDGLWQDYVEDLRAQGRVYAQLGMTFESWYRVVASFREAVLPLLVESYPDPETLGSALEGMDAFVDVALASIGTTYLEEKTAILAAQQEELQRARARLREESQFRAALEALPDAVLVTDAAGRVVLANSEAERLLARSRDKLVGSELTSLVGVGGPHACALRADGSKVPVELTQRPYSTEDGLLEITALRDISARVQADELLRKSERQLRQAQEIALLGSWEWDCRARQMSWSEQLYRIYGLEPRQVEPSFEAFLAQIHPEDRARIAQEVETALATGRGFVQLERSVRPDGEVRWLHSWAEPIFDESGTPIRYIGICQDVTEQRRQELELRRARDELELRVRERTEELRRSNADLEQFAYVASHDLQEPLRMVASFVGLIAQRYGDLFDETGKQWMGFAVEGATRMQELIEDLLTYSRAGKAQGPASAVSCEGCLRDALSNLHVAIQETGAEVTHDELPTVRASASLLRQVFQNLVANAIKFRGGQPPRIHVGVEREGNQWRFSVSDNGIGLDVSQADRIFQVFQRLHSRREYAGSGIGLAVAKRIVERYGGAIWVESTPGDGATFHFTLPAGDAS